MESVVPPRTLYIGCSTSGSILGFNIDRESWIVPLIGLFCRKLGLPTGTSIPVLVKAMVENGHTDDQNLASLYEGELAELRKGYQAFLEGGQQDPFDKKYPGILYRYPGQPPNINEAWDLAHVAEPKKLPLALAFATLCEEIQRERRATAAARRQRREEEDNEEDGETEEEVHQRHIENEDPAFHQMLRHLGHAPEECDTMDSYKEDEASGGEPG